MSRIKLTFNGLTCTQHHNKAMELVAQVIVLRRKRLRIPDGKKIQQLSIEAWQHESNAAILATAQPTKAILFRSAATLAMDAGDLPIALELAAKGLRGVEHDEIRCELIDVIKKAAQKL